MVATEVYFYLAQGFEFDSTLSLKMQLGFGYDSHHISEMTDPNKPFASLSWKRCLLKAFRTPLPAVSVLVPFVTFCQKPLVCCY